jgi:Mce-associated membrane protein
VTRLSEAGGSGDRDGSARAAGAGPEVYGKGVGNGTELVRPASDSHGLEPAGGLESSDDSDLDGEFDYIDDEYPGRPFWLRTSTLVVVVVVLFVVSGAVTAWLRISDLQQQVNGLEAQAFAGEEARQAAIVLAEDLATYDYRDLGGNFRHVAANCTPRFAGELRQLTEELGPELQQSRAVASATVRSAGVVRADADKAVVAVFVDQTVTNTRSPEPRTERSRMELTLVKLDGVWRLDQAGEL